MPPYRLFRRWKILVLGLTVASVMVVWMPTRADLVDDTLVGLPYHRESRDQVMIDQVGPLVVQFCGECHLGEDLEGDFSFGPLIESDELLRQRGVWERVISQLREGVMPPEDSPQPAELQRTWLMTWLESAVTDRMAARDDRPGSVTLRRLNRTEYRNTIRDLLGVDYAPADDFLADDVGYGFDNNGDVLSIPPVLMEKYLDAAELITALAIETRQFEPLDERVLGSEMELPELAYAQNDGSSVLLSESTMTHSIYFPYDGDYELRITAYGDQAGDAPARMELRLGGRPVERFEVASTSSEPGTYSTTVSVDQGEHRISLSFLNDYYRPEAADPDDRDRNLHISHLDILGPEDFEPPEKPETHQRLFIVEPSDEIPPRDAASRILLRFASRAYRRPTTEAELSRLLELFDAEQARGAHFEESVQFTVQAVLISPHFLFRVEPEPTGDNRSYRPLNDFELATRLSYFLWSTMPDDELFRLAKEGKLREGDTLERQVRRMLDDPKVEQLVENFSGQWLQLRRLDDAAPDAQLFPAFNDELREAMRKESFLFFSYILRNDRPLLELLDADYTFVNEPLARLYGIEGVTGEEFRHVSLEGTPRGGVLTQASVLTVTSNATRTSPVKRGYWVLANLLGEPPPPPAADAAPLAEGEDAAGTMRQQLERHRADPKCATCHDKMDPLGFALENFDAIGAFRDSEGGFPIDASGQMPDGASFDGVEEMRAMLLDERRDAFLRCLTEKMFIYALGRGLNGADEPALQKIMANIEENDFRFSSLILSIVQSDPFIHRHKEGSEP